MGNKTEIRRLKKLVKLSYLQTVAVVEGDSSKEDYVGTPNTFARSYNKYSSPDFWFGFSAGIMGDPGGQKSLEYSDTGWIVSKTWLETNWDKIRYAIGLRDIGIHQFEYAPTSEIISRPWVSPKEIEKALLMVDQVIPNDFPIGPSYIDYYIAPHPGTEWIRINPLDHPTIFDDDGGVVPRIVNFNTEQPASATNENKYVDTETPVTAVKFRAVLRRPEGIENAVAMTPILKGYRVLMYPKGGLT